MAELSLRHCQRAGIQHWRNLVLAVVYKILARIISMNIPYLTDLLQQVMNMAKGG